MKEIFKDIEGYEGLYQVSNFGRVKSLGNDKTRKEKILKPAKNIKYGYLYIVLCKQGKRKQHLVHRLVASAFLPNPNNLPEINHRDECKTNNNCSNLEWCDRQYNIDYSNSKQVLCVETGKIYPSAHEAKRQLGFNNTHISSACRGRLKTYKGFHWQYANG